jgi:hypothetical protein
MSVLSGLYLLDVLESNPEIFSRREIRTLRRASARLEEFFDRGEGDVVFAVRAGFADPPTVLQQRRPVEELILE